MSEVSFHIYNIKILNMTGNSSVNLGNNNKSGSSFTSKNQGVNSSIGDFSSVETEMENYSNDSDYKDQSSENSPATSTQ